MFITITTTCETNCHCSVPLFIPAVPRPYCDTRKSNVRRASCERITAKAAVAPSIEAFSAWAASAGVDLSRLEVTDMGSRGRGMIATRAINKGENLLSVDMKAALQTTSVESRCPRKRLVSDEVWRECPWWARLGLLLLYEKYVKKGAGWRPWVRLLPARDEFETLLHWADGEVEELQYDVMKRLVDEQRNLYHRVWERIEPEEIGKKVGFAEFLWAVECVRSRAFSGELEAASFEERMKLLGFTAIIALTSWLAHLLTFEQAVNGAATVAFGLLMYDFLFPRVMKHLQGVALKRYVLTPGLDFVNHTSRVLGEAEVRYEYFTDRFCVEAGESYVDGEEVFISYGRQSNDAFLQYYGFVEEGNPADEYVFSDDVALALGLDKGALKASKSAGFDKTVMKAVKNRLNGNAESVNVFLRELCETEVATKPTNIREDKELLKASHPRRKRLAIMFRIEKKKVLQDLIDMYSSD